MAEDIRLGFLEKMEEVEPDALKSGVGRVRSIFQRSNGEFYCSKRLAIVVQAAFVGGLAAFAIGGRFGSRIAVRAHILNNQLTKYPSTVQAARELHSATFIGFVKSGSMWGWRATVLAGTYSLYQTVGKEYRDVDDGINYAMAGVATGFTYKLFSGPRQMFVAVLIGTLFSVPVGLIMQTLRWVLPADVKDIMDKKRRLERKGEFLETEEREGRTDQIISELERDIEMTNAMLKDSNYSDDIEDNL